MGIAYIVPLSAIGGKRQLMFLTDGQNFVKGEQSALKDTTHEMLIVIANFGYTDEIMDAAQRAGAAGGTVIHAKGTGMDGAEKFPVLRNILKKTPVFHQKQATKMQLSTPKKQGNKRRGCWTEIRKHGRF